jgi:hypothetical protein
VPGAANGRQVSASRALEIQSKAAAAAARHRIAAKAAARRPIFGCSAGKTASPLWSAAATLQNIARGATRQR